MKNKKHRVRGTIKSFFEKYADPEKREKLKETRKDMKEKTKIILDIMGNHEGGNAIDESKRGFVAELIEDFQKQYETLYTHYDHLAEELKSKAHHENKETFSSSDSDSEKSSKNGRLENEVHEELTNKVAALSSEKEQLTSALDDASETEANLLKQIGELSLQNDNLVILKDEAIQRAEEGNQQMEALKSKVDQLEGEKLSLEVELNTIGQEFSGLKQELDSARQETENLNQTMRDVEEENKSLSLKISEMSDELKKAQDTIEVQERDFSSIQEMHESHKSTLEHELNNLRVQDREMKLELERKTDDIAENLIHIEGLNEKLYTQSKDAAQLREEITQFQAKILELEKMVDEKEGFSRNFSLLDTENTELKGKLEDQLRILKAVEDELNEKNEQFTQLETRFLELENVVEEKGRKLEELEKHIETVEDLERTIEDLKRDLEASEDEAYTATEKTRTIEVQLRLSNQKLRVTEQLLVEKEESFNVAEKKYLEECKHLEEKITKLTHIITLHNETYQRMITNICESMYNSLSGMESVAKRYEDEHEKFSRDILNMSQEIQIVKHLEMGKKTERENFEKEKTNMLKLLEEEKHEGSVMREKINRLKNEVDIAVKKKDEMKAEMEEEKREAIRQLCIWCDYLLNCNNELKEIVSKFNIRRQQQQQTR